MMERVPRGTDSWPEFYDPDLYEQKVGPGLRVGDAYTQLFAEGGSKLIAEYGCGPGEILIGLARAGHSVIGIDRSEQMVARANLRVSEEAQSIARRITVLHTAIENLILPQPVDAVLMTNEFVLHIFEASDLIKVFAVAWKNIALDGRIILDIPIIDFELLANASGKKRDQEYCRGYFPMTDGATLRVSERISFSTDTWIKEMMFRYERIGANGRATASFFRRLEQRVWTTQEVCFALKIAGVDKVSVRRLRGFSDRIFILAEK